MTVVLERSQQIERRLRSKREQIVNRGSRARRRASISAVRLWLSTHRSTAVFSPLKLKSSVLPFMRARVEFDGARIAMGAN